MNLKCYENVKDGDYFVIKVLMRLFKEKVTSLNSGSWKGVKGVGSLIGSCYESRKTHSSEPTIINYCYWPSDGNFGFPDSMYVVYIANIIKEFKPKMNERENKFITKMFFDKLTGHLSLKNTGYRYDKQSDMLIFSNSKLIYDAISMIDNRYADIMETILNDEEGYRNLPL